LRWFAAPVDFVRAGWSDHHSLLPSNEPIDLLNVAFENPRAIAAAQALRDLLAQRADNPKHKQRNATTTPELPVPAMYDVPDRLTGRESLEILRQLHPKRDWRFVEIDIDYEVSQSTELRIADLALIFPHRTGIPSLERSRASADVPLGYG